MESAGMAFAIIFTIIVIAFLLVFGYQQITQWLCFQEQAQALKTLRGIEDTAERNYEKGEDSTDRYKVSLPEDSSICFVDPQRPEKKIYSGNKAAQSWNPENLDAAKVMIRNQGFNMIYTVGCQAGLQGYKIDILFPSSGNFCARNGMWIIFTNKGLSVGVGPE